MKRKLRVLFLIALLTASGIVGFQVYWLNQAYTLNKRSFIQIASVTLQRSIDNYFLQNEPKPKGQIDSAGPPISFITTRNDTTLSASQSRVNFGTANLHNLQVIMAQALFQLSNKPFELDSLSLSYKAALSRENIQLPFRLGMTDTSQNPIRGYATINGKDAVIYASFPDSNTWVWKKTFMALEVSFLLILMTASCLWYMWRMIWRQKQLDDLKNAFIDNVTHELRTPIATLKSTHEALLNFGEVKDKEKTIRYLQLNARELDQLEGKVDRLLDLTRLEAGAETLELGWVNLSAIVDPIMDQYAQAEVRLVVSYNLPGVFVWSNAPALEAIIGNLIDNAVKYEGSTVYISIDVLLSGWVLQVKDDGIGIARSHLPHIFEKFYRVPSGNLQTVRGYGIGLSYVAALVRQLKGSTDVDSEIGKGTQFSIKFPESWIQ
jgi:two-component system phosphate regulon sensor histidine kinase PhoR